MNRITVTRLSKVKDSTVVDVREGDEYRLGHIPDAVDIPFSQLSGRFGELPVGGAFFVVRQSGARSAQAIRVVNAVGIHAVNGDEGTAVWINAGQPVQAQ